MGGLTPLARRALDEMLLEAFTARETAAANARRLEIELKKQEAIAEKANAAFCELCGALDVSGPETKSYLDRLTDIQTQEFMTGAKGRPWDVRP